MRIKNKHFKAFLITIILAAPAFWMVFVTDGQRFADITILKIKGGDVMDIHLKALSSFITEDDLKKQLPDVSFNCAAQPNPFGDYICQATIASFNGVPGRYGIYYFKQKYLSAFKLGYQGRYHQVMLDYIRGELGNADKEPNETIPTSMDVYHWRVNNGQLVALKENAIKNQEPAIIWTTVR